MVQQSMKHYCDVVVPNKDSEAFIEIRQQLPCEGFGIIGEGMACEIGLGIRESCRSARVH